MMTLLLPLLLSLSLLLLPLLLLPLPHASSSSTSQLELSEGLRLSPNSSVYLYDPPGYFLPMSNATMFTVGIPAFGHENFAVFLPILSSPAFNSSNSSQSPGFSFGFFSNSSSEIYLAVCGGLSGNFSNLTGFSFYYMYGANDTSPLALPGVKDGYAVPVWIANPFTSLKSFNASLVVVEEGGSKQVQLQDYDGKVLWNVSNVGLMEMEDTGHLTIYDTIHKTKVMVWQSPPRDTLFRGEKLRVGMQLTSNDSSYMARFEKGGLVLYLNTLHFMGERPAPYWAIPAPFNFSYHDPFTDLYNLSSDDPFNVRNKVMSSPCSGPNINDSTAYALLDENSWLNLYPGACSNDSSLAIAPGVYGNENAADPFKRGPLSFVKMENDGWLRNYAVPLDLAAPMPSLLPRWDGLSLFTQEAEYTREILQVELWEGCTVPYACGPLGVCTPRVANPCTCPTDPPSSNQATFHPNYDNDYSKGCSRKTKLPNCTKDEHFNTTDFLQLNHTASIFLFGGWLFNSTAPTKVEACKSICSSNCSCSGFIYKANNSACFFITGEMSLLNLTMLEWEVQALNSNYVTYLKKVKADQIGQATPSSQAGIGKTTVIAIVSALAACVVLAFALLLNSRARKCTLLNKQARQAEEELREVLPLLPSRFSYQDLHRATNGFSKLLGAGGCGSVYVGMLQDGRKVAVKTLEFNMKDQCKQFLAEVATIGQTNHHNIVRLVGFCWEVSSRLLVYEYMERGSLDHWLFHKFTNNASCDDEGAAPLLDWKTRFNVVLGVIQGLSYLHEECPQPILHFDIKPQNILLDGDFVAKLADFGMSRLMKRDVSEVVTGLRGTPGYIAPEWLLHGAVSKKGDIYSMGMVILEIVGGRKNVDLDLLNNANAGLNEGEKHEPWHFPSWAARKCELGREMDLVDKRLQGAFNEAEAQRLIYTAFWCIQEDPAMRPYAPTLLQWLKGSSPVKQPPFSSASHSSFGSTSSSSSHTFNALGIISSRSGLQSNT